MFGITLQQKQIAFCSTLHSTSDQVSVSHFEYSNDEDEEGEYEDHGRPPIPSHTRVHPVVGVYAIKENIVK